MNAPPRLVALTLLALGLVHATGRSQESTRQATPSSPDARLGPLKDLNGYFPFTPPETREAWEARRARLRRQVLVSQGLWPMPTKTPLNAVIHSRRELDGYSIEKVYFESYPGNFVTGSLYRPLGKSGRLPAVLSPHGHWAEGRFHEAGEEEIKKQIESGAEKMASAARSPLQARCVQLARMGCVVFHYDMVGYADSRQLAHRPAVRKAMNTPENWGYFSPQAELRLQNMMGLQTYNSLRALDFLTGLPDVDPARIGVTGASGGGTQTFMLCAIDPRPAVSFPAVMVSTAMQGGCTCENACYLRIGTGNIELAGLFAPKPLAMTGANDWTLEILTKGLPELKTLYELLGAPANVKAEAFPQFGHNYNGVSRAVMYAWMNEHLDLGVDGPIEEADFAWQSPQELTVWDAEHPAPSGGDDYERSLLRWITSDSEKQIGALTPRDADSLAAFREVVGGAWEAILGSGRDASFEVARKAEGTPTVPGAGVTALTVSASDNGSSIPCWLAPNTESEPPQRGVVVWLDARGKRGLLGEDGRLRAPVQRLVDSGFVVLGCDLIGQGEHVAESVPTDANRQVGVTPSELEGYAGYTYGYNPPLFAQRAHDVQTVLRAAAAIAADSGKAVHLMALNGAGAWGLAGASLAGGDVSSVAADTEGFRFARLQSLTDAQFLPGAVKYGDLPGLMALAAPRRLWVAGEKGAEGLVEAVYRAAGAADALTLDQGGADARDAAAVDWLLANPPNPR